MKTLKYILLFFLFPVMLTGQNKVFTDTILPNVSVAMRYIYAIESPYFPERAYEILQKGADLNLPAYMNALGVYYSGLPGIEADLEKATMWYKKAALTGDAKALYNLGMVYKYGRGVKQDLEKAFYYAQLSAEKGNVNGCYFAGYMLYKGLGCSQNYQEAIRYLQQSADQEHYPAMYLLGLCYGNGYGVERDSTTSKFFLEIAANRGYSFAQDELEKEAPELDYNSTTLKSASVNNSDVPEKFNPIDSKNLSNKSITGSYTGNLITYDWSGENVLAQSSLKLYLELRNDTLKGNWIQDDSTVVVFTAKLNEEGLIFTDAVVPRKDHYNEFPLIYQFTKASLSITEGEEDVLMAGNLQLYSTITMEPERPIYLSLKKNEDNKELMKGTQVQGITDLIAFPNPFKNQLKVIFMLSENSNVQLELLNTNGSCVYKAYSDNLPSGQNSLTANVLLPTGSYILLLKTKHYQASTMVVKE